MKKNEASDVAGLISALYSEEYEWERSAISIDVIEHIMAALGMVVSEIDCTIVCPVPFYTPFAERKMPANCFMVSNLQYISRGRDVVTFIGSNDIVSIPTDHKPIFSISFKRVD